MSLLSYEEVRPWAKSIRREVAQRTMPPFSAVGPEGYFQNDLRLLESEIATLLAWVDQGVARGRPEDAPPPKTWNTGKGEISNPDLVVRFPSFRSSSSVEDKFLMLYSEHVFEDETWIEEMELRFSDYSLPHHAGVFSASEDFYIPEDRVFEDFPLLLQENILFTWLPGKGVERRPGGVFRIRPGDRLVLQLHVSPTQEAETGEVEIAIRFADGAYDKDVAGILQSFRDFVVPAREPEYVLSQTTGLPSSAKIVGFRAHMHLLGKSVKFILHYPDGRSRTVFEIPDWDFVWQRLYWLAEPIEVPTGTRWETVATWDNSDANPFNPDPAQPAAWGPRTSEEMMDAVLFYVVERDEPLRIQRGHSIE